jgi:hypothetical protein
VLGSYFYHPDTISAGASGAIFGLFGVLLVFGFRYRHSIPPFFKQAVGTGVLPVIVINLIIGFTIPAIDNSAHISGLLAGALTAAIIPFQRPGEMTPPGIKMAAIVLVVVVGMSFYAVASNYHASPASFINAMNEAQRTFSESADALSEGQTGNLAGMREQLADSIDQLRNTAALDAGTDELTAGLLKVMEDQYALVQEIDRAGTMTFGDHRRLSENKQRFEELMDSFSDWVANEGRKYGIQMGNRP